MAITDLGTLGTGSNKTSGTTLAVTNTTGATIAAGTFMVLALTFDNHASTTAATLSLSASGGGTWTQRGSTTGSGVTTTAGSGIWGAVFTTKTVSTIASGATITTITFGSAVVAKAAIIEGFTGVDDTLRNTVASGTSTGGTPSTTTTGTALVAGDLVVGTAHGENNAAPTGDADTLNGSWDAIQETHTAASTAATNVTVGVQDKEVTATGAQTYNPTGMVADSVAFVMAFTPSPQSATATPSVVAATTAVATVSPVVKAAAVAAVTAIATLTGNIVPNLAAVASIPTPTISDGSSSATATPSVVAATTSIPTPAVATGSATVTPTRVSAAATIPTPSVQGNPTWFTSWSDGTTPELLVSAEDWGILPNGGLNHSGDFAATYSDYFTSREAQGYNSILTSVFSFTTLTGGANGPDSDGTYPFNTNSTNPSNTPNTTFWARRDAFLTTAASHGFRVMLNITTPLLHLGSFTASWTNTQWTDFGTFLAGRYASQSNIMWMVGDDYFDDNDSGLDALLAALRAGGANQPITIQNYQETSSRKDIYNGGTRPWGNTNAQYNFGYSYNVSYDVVEKMGNEANPLPYFWGDGTFLNTGGITGLTDKQLMRRLVWWALSSGSKGFQVGDNNIWPWDSTALAEVTSNTFYTDVVPAIASYFPTLPNWHRLKADTSNVLVTAGRGTHASPLVSGGSGGQYLSNSDSYVTASRTADGTLAVIYMSHGSTITIDESQLVAGYVATWVDPKTCATSAATAGSTYNSTAKGNNSDGQADWVLVLQAPTGVTATPSVVSAVTTVPAAAPKTGVTVSASVVSATTTVPAAAPKTGETVAASVVNATTSIATPTVTSRATATPAVVSLAASVATPSVGAGVTATPSVVVATTAIPTPTVSVSGNATATPTVVAAVASIPSPAVSAGGSSTVSATVVNGTASVPTPTVSVGVSVTAGTVQAATTVAAPAVTSSATATPTVVAAVFTIPVPTVTAGGNATVNAATVSGTATLAQPAVRTGSTVTPVRVSAVATVAAPTVTSPANVSPAAVNATASVPSPSVSTTSSAQVQLAVVQARASVPAPGVTATGSIDPADVQVTLVAAVLSRDLTARTATRELTAAVLTRTLEED